MCDVPRDPWCKDRKWHISAGQVWVELEHILNLSTKVGMRGGWRILWLWIGEDCLIQLPVAPDGLGHCFVAASRSVQLQHKNFD